MSANNDNDTSVRVGRIARLIEGFETPYGMELLGTVDWVAKDAPDGFSFDDVVTRVHGWNNRKREIMKPAHIRAAYDRLHQEGWV